MLKKMWRLCSLLMALCLLSASALAADQTVIHAWQEGEPVRTIQEVVTVGDTAYWRIRTDDGGEIWHWQEGMDKAEPIATGLTFASSYNDIAQAYEALAEAGEAGGILPDVEHAITCIFTDGATLYALNNLNGRVFTVTFAEGKAVFTDVVTLQDISVMYRENNGVRAYSKPASVCVAGDTLLWLDWRWPEGVHGYSATDEIYTLTCFSLKDGSSRAATLEDPRYVVPYKDGQALVLTPVWNPDVRYGQADAWRMFTYDPATDTATERGAIKPEVKGSTLSVIYAPQTDTVYYQQSGSILGKQDFGMPETYAMVSGRTLVDLAFVGNTLLMTSGSVKARTAVRAYEPEHMLNVGGDLPYDAQYSFESKHPTVPFRMKPVRYESQNDYAAWVESGLDVVMLNTAQGSYARAKAEDVFLDLSGSEIIREYVESLYPPFRELAMKDGRIVGIPVKATSNTGFYINKAVQQELGLVTEAIPTNLVELCAFVTDWNEHEAEKYPNCALLENIGESYRARIFKMMYSQWVGYCQTSGTGLHFDDPIFREMLTALDQIDASVLEKAWTRLNPEDSDYMRGLIWDGCMLVGNFASYMEEFSDRRFLPMTMTADTPYTARIDDVQMWSVAACTDDPGEAIAMLEEVILTMDVKQRAVMQTTWTKAVRNPEYETDLARTEKNIKTLQWMSIPNGDMSYREVDAAIRVAKNFIKNDARRKEYRITASALENYQKVIAPVMYVSAQGEMIDDAVLSNALYTLREMYAEKLIDMETFIATADALLTVDAAMEQGAEAERRLYQMREALAFTDHFAGFQQIIDTWIKPVK